MTNLKTKTPAPIPGTKKDWLIVGCVFIALSVILIVALIIVILIAVSFDNFVTRAFSTTQSCDANPSYCQYINTAYPTGVPSKTFSKPIALFCAQSILNLEEAVSKNENTFTILAPLTLIGTIQIPSEYGQSGYTFNFGYVALDSAAKILYIFFRGTQSSQEWNYDFMYRQDQAAYLGGLFGGSLIHVGFGEIWTQIETTVAKYVTSAIGTFNSIIVSGHSLGAAIASICCAYLINDMSFTSVYGYTYGQPRTGNATFCNTMDSVFSTLTNSAFFRIQNVVDLVPDLPLAVMPSLTNNGIFFYNHFGQNQRYQLNWNSLSLNHFLGNYIQGITTLL